MYIDELLLDDMVDAGGDDNMSSSERTYTAFFRVSIMYKMLVRDAVARGVPSREKGRCGHAIESVFRGASGRLVWSSEGSRKSASICFK